MARAKDNSSSLRLSRRDIARAVVAILVSLLLHLCIWGGYRLAHNLALLEKLHAPEWLIAEAKKLNTPPPPPKEEEPTTFVDVSHADDDAPTKPKYYSYRNSHAANPVEAKENNPAITGNQKVVPKTEDTEKAPRKEHNTPENKPAPQFSKLQPAVPASPPPQTPGETELLKTNDPTLTSKQKPEQPQPERPRTISQALAQRNQLVGQKMQQNGGVSRHAQFTALDAKATPFGEYDLAIIEAVQQHWYDLLDSHRYADDRTGKVQLVFKLKSDGTVIEVRIIENTVGDVLGYLCQDAVEEAGPFAKWPPDMVRMIGANYREVTFTFYYY